MCIAYLYMCAIWTLFSSLVAPDRGPDSSFGTSRLESLNHTPQVMKTVSRNAASQKPENGTLPPYLQLPVFLQSRLPLIEKEHFFPTRGTGQEPLPYPVKEILLPVSPTENPSTASNSSVKTFCNVNQMHVQVQKSVLGTGGSSSLLKLGTCQVSRSTTDSLYFEYDLGSCGSKRTMINNRVAFSNTLRYDPPRLPGPIRRAVPFTLPVACHYNRYQYSYKIGYIPKIQMHKRFKPMKNSPKFILSPRNAQWERLCPSDHYVIGKPMYFQAEAQSMSPDERLYVHFCHATLKKSHISVPQFPVVENFGCIVESKDNRSRFIPHTQNVVRFTVDAFLFKGMTGQQLYMHCIMSVGSPVPTPTAKSCNYDTRARRWRELHGPASVCSCCDSKCHDTASADMRHFPVTRMVSSRPWTMESKVTHTTTPKRKAATTPTKKARKTTLTTTTSLPKETGLAPVDKVEDTVKELEWPLGGGRVQWVEAEAEERRMKGFALVEEEQVSQPRTIFEDIFGMDK